jgi:hypothetical protein
MNIAVGIWLPEGAQFEPDRWLRQWQTEHWQGACHSVQLFIASEKPLTPGPLPKGVAIVEHIDTYPLIDEVVSQLRDHWVDNWMRRHRETLKIFGVRAEAIEVDEAERNVENWLKEWLRYWSAYQVIQRYYSTYYGSETVDATFLCTADFAFRHDSAPLGDLYLRVSEWPKHNAERRAAYRWPPLNGASTVLTAGENGGLKLLGGQYFTLGQLLNPKNIRLYFSEHLQLLQSAMPTDLNPVTCIARLLEIQFEDFASHLRPQVAAVSTHEVSP